MATKIRVKGDPQPKVVVSETITPSKTIVDDRFDVRDIVSNMAGSGSVDLTNPDTRANFLHLQGKLGAPKAQKLIAHLTAFNSRPEVQKMTPEQRVQSLYSLGSQDADVAETLKQGNALGYGVLNGLRTSPLVGNMKLTGRNTGGGVGEKTTADKIKLLVKNTTK